MKGSYEGKVYLAVVVELSILKEDALILCNSEFRAEALVRQKTIYSNLDTLTYNTIKAVIKYEIIIKYFADFCRHVENIWSLWVVCCCFVVR